MNGTLLSKGMLSRRIEAVTPEGRFVVEYQGGGMGFEQVLVDGVVAARTRSTRWFVPWFDFRVGSLPALIEVQVWPWLSIKSLKLTVGGATLYSE